MALATRCPYCQTTFRVTHDQLKLRGGLVRCGACKEIFNGVEHLLAAQEPGASAAVSSLQAAAASASATPTAAPPAAPPAGASAPVDAPAAPPDAAPAETPISTEPAQALPEPGIGGPTPTPATTSAAEPDEPQSGHSTSEEEQRAQASDFHPTAHPTDTSAAPNTEAPQPASPPASPPASQPYPQPSLQTQTGSARPYRQDIPSELPPTTPEQDIDPLTRMTLMDMRPWPQRETLPHAQTDASAGHPSHADEIDRALGELQQKPWRGSTGHVGGQDEADEIDALDNEEPDFVRQARLHAQRQRRSRLILGLASGVLAVFALLQLTLLMRTDIAARWPATRPALTSLCNITGCTLGLPQQIEYVTIESHELQALPNSENGFVLSTLLRNRSKVVQAWPHLELTLNDAAEQPVARRVLTPADYLSAQERARGMPPSSEKSVRVPFTLAQLKASGYRLYVFYP